MKGKIDKDGRLFIARPLKLKRMFCPWSNPADYCGDLCPHFREPEWNFKLSNPEDDNSDRIKCGPVILKICDENKIFFEEFEDERQKHRCLNCGEMI